MDHKIKQIAIQRGGWLGRVAIFSLLILLFCSLSASAQPDQNAEQVRKEIAKTELIIQKAKELAREAVSLSTHTHLKTAIQNQKSAISELRQRRYAAALRLTSAARSEALKSMDAVRLERRAENSVLSAIEKVEETRDEIVSLVRESGNPTAVRIFDQGIKQLNRARQANENRRYSQASKLTVLARSLLDRAGRIISGEVSTGAAVESSIDRTEALLVQVSNTLLEKGVPREKQNRMREAERLLVSARDNLAKKNLRQAMAQCMQAKQKGLQLLGQVSEGRGKEYLAEAIEDLRSFYLEVAPEILANGSNENQKMAADGNKLLNRARSLLERGEIRKALQHMMAAERLIKDAAEKAGVM